MITISCASPKGGVGKTTVSTILATTLAAEKSGRRARVQVIDADPSANLTRWAAERAGQGRPELFKVTSGVVAETMIDTIDGIEEAGETDFLIIDLEGTAGEIVGYAIGRSDLTVIPMSASSMDARQAAKASQLVKRMAKTFKIDLPYVFAFCRTNAAIVTREHKGIIEQLEAHKEPVLGVDLKERSAYRAIFTEGATVTELAENKSGSIAKAQTNAVSFTQAVLDYLASTRSMSEAA